MARDTRGELKPFWRYYGGKWRAAPRYPAPRFGLIVEPFAGAAGYACRYPDRAVVLCDVYPVVAGIWRYLIATPAAEIRRIPFVEVVDDLPGWVPQEGRHLVGFWLNAATVSPCRVLSAGRKKLAKMGRVFEGWTPATRERVASQVDSIRHWQIYEGPYTDLPNAPATWFVDPPYSSPAGAHYVHSAVDFPALGAWCRERQGQVIVCENAGAAWLPFETFATFKPGVNGAGSREVVWLGGAP